MSSIVWFENPSGIWSRTKSFYGALLDWKIEKFPKPMEYWHIDTGGSSDAPRRRTLEAPAAATTRYN